MRVFSAAAHRAALAGSCALFALVAAQPVLAQDAGETQLLDEIVVTAQKRTENVMDVPSAISVVGGERLEQLHATTLSDYAAYVPGFNISTGGSPGLVSLSLRGISSIGGGATVGVYLDDAPVGASGMYARADSMALDLMPYDIQRVEVLRGPQGTLYGASTLGGLLKYVTHAPDLNDFEARVGGEVFSIEGSDDVGYGLRAGLNAPLVQDKLAIRASVYRQFTPGYIDNVATGQDDENETLQQGGRIALLWQATEDLQVRASAQHQVTDSDNFGAMTNLFTVSPAGTIRFSPIGDLQTDHEVPHFFDKRFTHLDLVANLDLGWATFTSSSAYEKSKTHQNIDVSPEFGLGNAFFSNFALPPGLTRFDLKLDLEKFTQEFRLASPTGGKLEWLVGAYYTYEDSENTQVLTALDANGTPIPTSQQAFDPFTGDPLLDFNGDPVSLNPFAVAGLPSTYREIALFGDLTYRFTDRFDITAGLRVARNSQTFAQIGGGTLIAFIQAPPFVPGKSKETVTTFMVSPRLHVTDDVMVYGRIASGYRPGGPNVVLSALTPAQVDADRLTNYELGIKGEFLGGKALIDASAFYIDWSDIQISSSISGAGFTDNAGDAVSKGFEISTVVSPVHGLRIGANAAYTDATLEGLSPTAVVGQVGDTLPNTPKWTASLTADYSFELAGFDARIGGGYRYVGSRVTDLSFTTTNQTKIPSYGVLDLNASLSNDRWTLSLFAKNLTDERAVTGLYVQGDAFTGDIARVTSHILQPRTIGLSLDAKF